VIGSLNNVVYINNFIGDADGACLKNMAGLLVGKAATFNVI